MFRVEESNSTMRIKGLFMKAGLSLNLVKYTDEAVKDMVKQINQHQKDVENGIKGQQYITMNYSHSTDETMGTVGKILSATYEPKYDGGEAYFEAEIYTDNETGKQVAKLIKDNALSHVSIYGYIENDDDATVVFDKNGNFKYIEVKKLTLVRVDFTKAPGIKAAYVVQASKEHKYIIGNEEILKSQNLIGGIMEKELKEAKAQTKIVVLEEELNKKQEELKETKAQLADLQKKVNELNETLTQEKEILQQAYSKIDSYMREAYLEELKATKGFSDGILNGVLTEMMKEKHFQSKELDTEKRYLEFKEFYKPVVESVEKMVKEIKESLSIKEEETKEVKENDNSKDDTSNVSDIISNLL